MTEEQKPEKKKRRTLEQQMADLKARMAEDTEKLLARDALQLAVKALNKKQYAEALDHIDVAREKIARLAPPAQGDIEAEAEVPFG